MIEESFGQGIGPDQLSLDVLANHLTLSKFA